MTRPCPDKNANEIRNKKTIFFFRRELRVTKFGGVEFRGNGKMIEKEKPMIKMCKKIRGGKKTRVKRKNPIGFIITRPCL